MAYKIVKVDHLGVPLGLVRGADKQSAIREASSRKAREPRATFQVINEATGGVEFST